MPYPIVFFFYRIAYYIVRFVFLFYYRISFEGRENIPNGTAIILHPITAAIWIRFSWQWLRRIPLTLLQKNHSSKILFSGISSDSWVPFLRQMPSTRSMTCSQRPRAAWTSAVI